MPRLTAQHGAPTGDSTSSPRLSTHGWNAWVSPATLSAWGALASSATEPNPFYESWYLLPSLRQLDAGGKVRLLVLEAAGRLVGLMPIRLNNSYYGYPLPHWRNWVHANCFLGAPLVAPGFERAFWAALLQWCDARPHPSLFLHLAHMPASGRLHDALAEVLRDQPRPAATVLREERALLSSALTPADYLDASLSGKKRKELRRQQRRLAETGSLSVTRENHDIGVEHWAGEFLALERAGWKGQAGSALASHPATARLFREALAGAARRGRLERLAIRLDGRPIAMLASFTCPPGMFSYKTAFDEGHARFSPGVLLQCENLAALDDPRIQWVDSCAAQDHPMIDHIWRERRPIARHSIAIGGAVRRSLFRWLVARETGTKPEGIS